MNGQAYAAGIHPPGVILPSMIWTNDRDAIAADTKRLLGMQQQLVAVLQSVPSTDQQAFWHTLIREALFQLQRDIDVLQRWLEDSQSHLPQEWGHRGH